jgi:cell division protein FtsW (lipid II flippase)
MKTLLMLLFIAGFFAPLSASAQLTERRVEKIESRVSRLEREGRSWAGAAFVSAVLAALWAQNTRRNAWLWFFAGLLLAPVTLLVLLYKNSIDVGARR